MVWAEIPKHGGVAHSRDCTGMMGWSPGPMGGGGVKHRETMLKHQQNAASTKKVGRFQGGVKRWQIVQ